MSGSRSSNGKSNLTVRPAKYSELFVCAQVIADSFRNDILFGEMIHPHRHQYPDDMALYFYRAFQSDFWDWSMVLLVCTERDEKQKAGEDTITGFAQWHRIGHTARRDGWALAAWDPRNLLYPLSRAHARLCSLVHPNRAISHQHSTILAEADPFTAHIWEEQDTVEDDNNNSDNSPTSRRDRWYLHFLGVHPAHQNRGIGRRLVSWGIDQAAREGVGTAVVAAYRKDRFYHTCGFEYVLGRSGQGVGNPLGVVPGGNMWWIPPRPSFSGSSLSFPVTSSKKSKDDAVTTAQRRRRQQKLLLRAGYWDPNDERNFIVTLPTATNTSETTTLTGDTATTPTIQT